MIRLFGLPYFRVAELRLANLTGHIFYSSPTFLYLPGRVMKALDPSVLAPKILIPKKKYLFLAYSLTEPITSPAPRGQYTASRGSPVAVRSNFDSLGVNTREVFLLFSHNFLGCGSYDLGIWQKLSPMSPLPSYTY